jgi:hypothetical protein
MDDGSPTDELFQIPDNLQVRRHCKHILCYGETQNKKKERKKQLIQLTARILFLGEFETRL